jgi:hypothetical protein
MTAAAQALGTAILYASLKRLALTRSENGRP